LLGDEQLLVNVISRGSARHHGSHVSVRSQQHRVEVIIITATCTSSAANTISTAVAVTVAAEYLPSSSYIE